MSPIVRGREQPDWNQQPGGALASGVGKTMTHEHGSEYRLRILREDETEELSAWMNCPEKIAHAISALHRWRGRAYWLQVRNILCADCVQREVTIAEFPLTLTEVSQARFPSQTNTRQRGA